MKLRAFLSSARPSTDLADSQMQEAVAAAKTWLVNCEKNHESCRKKPRFSRISDHGSPLLGAAHTVEDLDVTNSMPKRLLSFKLHPKGEDAVKLVDVTKPMRYVALSHRWGPGDHCKTDKDNLKDMQTKGIAVQDLPRTFRDAVHIARGLGITYIWIDSLCIIQGKNPDDFPGNDSVSGMMSKMFPNRDFMREAPRMACIYGNSVCTIAAVDGTDCSSGLYPSSHSMTTRRNELDSRAWVLQERMIPPRSLLFTNDGLIWECRQCNASLGSRIFNFRDTSSMENPKDLFTFFRDWRIPGANIQEDQHMVIFLGDDLTELRAEPKAYFPFMQAWWKFISRYTACQLSHDQDKFLAMNGIANITLRWVHMVNYFGLWSNFFHSDLTWYVDKDGLEPSRPDGFLVPSWSWASTRGRIRNSCWERSDPGAAIMQMKQTARPPQSTSFDLPLPYPPWSTLYSLSTDIKGTLRQGTIKCTRDSNGKRQYDVQLERYARWSDEETHEFWPDCPDEFPPGSAVPVHVLHMWHYNKDEKSSYCDVRLVLSRLEHISTDQPPLADAENESKRVNPKTGRICDGQPLRIVFQEMHYSPDFPTGQEWLHQLQWQESDSLADDDEEFYNSRTFVRKGYLETRYENRRDEEGINEDYMWHTVRLL